MDKKIANYINTIHILGIITLAELIISGSMGSSVMLWILYGIYKILTY